MQSQPLSLSGEWTGVYDYADPDAEAVPFNATLTDIAGVLWGNTVEPNTFSPTQTNHLTASVNGVRTQREVRFRKEYENVIGGEDIVHYMGEVSPNGRRISGEWRIILPGQSIGGVFVMNRQDGLKADKAVERDAEAELEAVAAVEVDGEPDR